MAVVTAVATIGGMAIAAGPASAGTTTLCSGGSFSTCINAGFSAHGYENHYTSSYWAAASGHNCTNYVGFMLTQNGDSGHGAMGNAKDWDNTIAAHPEWGYTLNQVPTVGSIAQWEANVGPALSEGHVAYVEGVAQTGGVTTITISEDNYPSGPFSWKKITSDSSHWPTRFLHIKDAQVSASPWQWHLRDMNTDGPASMAFSYGSYASNDHPITGDWDGNGTFTPGIVRNVNGQWQWHLRNDNSDGGAFVSFTFGSASDNPIIGDWDGNGTMTAGITRVVNGEIQWHLKNVNDNGGAFTSFNFGLGTDGPITGDWDGNGTFTPGIVRNVNGDFWWHLRSENSAGGAYASFNFGAAATDHPKVGDWDGDGTYTPGIVRNSQGGWQWHFRNMNSAGGASLSFTYGLAATDMPIVGDWNGDGTVTAGITRAG